MNSKIKKHVYFLIGFFTFILILSVVSCNNPPSNKAKDSSIKTVVQPEPVKKPSNELQFTVLREWTTPGGAGGPGIGREILVSPLAKKEDILQLAADIRKQFDGHSMFISIFDDKKAWENRTNMNYPENDYYLHYLVEITVNKNTGFDEIQWTAKGRKI